MEEINLNPKQNSNQTEKKQMNLRKDYQMVKH